MSDESLRAVATIAKEEYLVLARRSYGWTIGNDGSVCGLVAGDQGYDFSSINLGALVAVTFDLCATGDESQRFQDASEALMSLCAALHLRQPGEEFPSDPEPEATTLRAERDAALARVAVLEEALRKAEQDLEATRKFIPPESAEADNLDAAVYDIAAALGDAT